MLCGNREWSLRPRVTPPALMKGLQVVFEAEASTKRHDIQINFLLFPSIHWIGFCKYVENVGGQSRRSSTCAPITQGI